MAEAVTAVGTAPLVRHVWTARDSSFSGRNMSGAPSSCRRGAVTARNLRTTTWSRPTAAAAGAAPTAGLSVPLPNEVYVRWRQVQPTKLSHVDSYGGDVYEVRQ